MPSIPRYATGTAQGAPGPAAAVGPGRWPGPRVRGDRRPARAERRGVRPARGDRLPGPPPAGGGRPAAQLLGRAGGPAPAAVRAHGKGGVGAGPAAERVAPVLDRGPGGGRRAGVSADLIEGYLDRLLGHLRGSAHDVRRILAETEEHLRDATAELVAAGAGEEEAERRAIERFGDPRAVARRFSARLAPVPPAAVAAELAGTAELLGRLYGPGFVAGDLPGVTYTRERCAEFLEYFPHAGGCEQAATLHHWGEVVEYRVA